MDARHLPALLRRQGNRSADGELACKLREKSSSSAATHPETTRHRAVPIAPDGTPDREEIYPASW